MSEGRTLVLLRHGRTPWNHSGRIQGHADVELDDHGVAQAARTAPVLAALQPALIWSSDLLRARLTAAPLAEACGLPVTTDARLREFGFGPYEGLTHAALGASDPASHAAMRRGDYDQVTHAEPTDVVRARMLAVLTDLRDALSPGETGIAVSHGAAVRLATAAVLGWPDEQFRTLRGLDNCGWVVLHEHPADGVLRLAAYNRTVS
ncbi:histidine phosphatase family protein [Nocardioides plantarum]|uniref:Histidine phosphatase family protein n=1 Tax=Nocardioides plantarum TaxID=29299 RepID=A0ABV5K6W8_9ACTN|nr:histidine phosphatase family protein [Nocardioides plantarum]